MPISYDIDSERGLVITRLSGTVSFDECAEHHCKLSADPAFDPAFRELLDGGAVERVALISTAIFSLSNSCPYESSARRAIYAGNKRVHFGLARMFQALASGKHGEIEVFRDRDEALQWLEGKTNSAKQPEKT